MPRRIAPLFALLLAIAPALVRAAPLHEVLGWPVVRSEGVAMLPKWNRLLARLAAEEPRLRACVEAPEACPGPAARRWGRLVAGLRGRPPAAMVEAVHAFAVSFPYRTDAEAWGRSDHWATPLEFLARSGDCEDYAILQYATLRLLGVPEEDMRLLVVRDTVRDLPHAVLEVEVDGRMMILDNLHARPMPPERLSHYRPYYAADARGVHFPLPALRTAVVDRGLFTAPARR